MNITELISKLSVIREVQGNCSVFGHLQGMSLDLGIVDAVHILRHREGAVALDPTLRPEFLSKVLLLLGHRGETLQSAG